MGSGITQPIIRGIQSVGSVRITYEYNGGDLVLPSSLMQLGDNAASVIKTAGGVNCAGFRLDGEFLRANPQIDSSFMVPLLGGGAIALTNNNRSGVLNLRTTRVSSPSTKGETTERTVTVTDPATGETLSSSTKKFVSGAVGAMESGNGVGPTDKTNQYYDITLLLQAQQAQTGGDSVGSTINVIFEFNGTVTTLSFQGCTVANIDPVGLSGNDAVDYNARINYLNWTVGYSQANSSVVGAD